MGPQKRIQKESTVEKLKIRKKESKQKIKEKRARLVIKNLPFNTTEDALREYFEKYGEIVDVKVLKKEDDTLLGCAFVQYKLVQKAAKARHHTNSKPFLGRDITVDFALAKDKFKKELKKEAINQLDTVVIKEETIKVESDDEAADVKMETNNSDSENEFSEQEAEDESSSEEMKEKNNEDVERTSKHFSNDITEGKTIFIKNVPFSATNDDVKKCMGQFGPLYYALVCKDKFTEHSKGTAFVKFVNKEDSEKALQAGTELTLLGNILDCHLALNKNEVHKKVSDKKGDKSGIKDSRNLYLVKEGVILAGTKAAQGVSPSDMAKRLQLEQYKTQMLKNLNMFVSRERLVIHNLPSTWDNKKLQTLCLKFAGNGAVIKEARIMRDMKNIDAQGVGTSKEFGFVAFTNHEHALKVLRMLNNNPNIFSAAKRPILTFSIEKRSVMKTKQRRLERSILNNPKSKKYDSSIVKKGSRISISKHDETENLDKFAGVVAKPGAIQKMRNRHKLNTQAKLHYENVKNEKHKKKMEKKSVEERKKESMKQSRQKINKNNKKSDNFSKLVNEYKKKLINAPVETKTKWYKS